ncbi:MAG: ABC transporter substrate-binding protein [Candidatus Latescibacteria bacterium]|nr:ABC transporter substrate-binding protein [Candidatus Latescibacterota bacterium]
MFLKRLFFIHSLLFCLPILFGLGCLAPDLEKQITHGKTSQGSQKQLAHQTSAPKTITAQILSHRTFGEAPQLLERTAAGELPPVSARLPDNPLIVVPLEEIGQYGGTIRRGLTGDIAQWPGVSKCVAENFLAFKRPMGDGIEPNLAERYEFRDDGKTAVFYFRKGIRWSDGHPFTVDDVLFYYNDMLFNENARSSDIPTPPPAWLVDGKPLVLEKIDDHTLRIRSPKPLGRLRETLASPTDFAAPKHYWKQFHPDYTPGTDFGNFRQQTTRAKLLMTPGIPRLSAWVAKEWIRGQRLVYIRNPYYWKIDSAGNQLPYADRIIFSVISDTQVILLKFINNEIDLFGRYSDVNMFHTLKLEEKKGTFKIVISGPNSGPSFYLNWDVKKPALREAFRNKNVRIALSHAINREEVNQILYKGFLEPSGYSFLPGNPYFTEKNYRKYTEHAPALANRLLDEAGYADSDGDGIRELKDGSPFQVVIEASGRSSISDICELVTDHWGDIGIKVHTYVAMRDIIWPRRFNGEFEIHQWGLEGPGDPLDRLDDWAVTSANTPFWHREASKGTQPWFQEATELMLKATTTVDTSLVRTYMEKASDLHSDNVPVITIGSIYRIWGKNTRLGNVPNDISFLGVHGAWGRPIFHEQIFIKKN